MLFSALKQTHSALITCDSERVIVAFLQHSGYPQKWCIYSKIWLLLAWCYPIRVIIFSHPIRVIIFSKSGARWARAALWSPTNPSNCGYTMSLNMALDIALIRHCDRIALIRHCDRTVRIIIFKSYGLKATHNNNQQVKSMTGVLNHIYWIKCACATT